MKLTKYLALLAATLACQTSAGAAGSSTGDTTRAPFGEATKSQFDFPHVDNSPDDAMSLDAPHDLSASPDEDTPTSAAHLTEPAVAVVAPARAHPVFPNPWPSVAGPQVYRRPW